MRRARPEPIGLIPPTRYQKNADGKKIYYISKMWLRGAKGAGYAARRRLVSILMKNDHVVFTPSAWDKCKLSHNSARGEASFTLHVDDGCAGWATTRALAISLYDLLELHYLGGQVEHR
jgi:hypothetical protein